MFDKLQKGTPESKQVSSAPLDNAAGNVLLKLMFHTNKSNIVKGTPQELSKKLGVTLWDFTYGIRALKKLNYVRKYTKWEYMINPNIIFNGDDRQYFITQYMWDTQTIQGIRK